MSEISTDEEYFDELLTTSDLDEKDILEIQKEYRKKRLMESITGPIVSTLFHVALIVILAIIIKDKYKQEAAEIVVEMQEVEEVKIEEPPPIEEPEPEEVETTEQNNPVLTTIAVESVDTNDAALEDVNDEVPSTEDDAAVEAVSDVVVSPSAFASPSVFGGRSAGGRASAVSRFGGSKVGQEKLLKALYWLKKVQNPDGSWSEGDTKDALTGLAMLTFLAHGETQTSKAFGVTVKKAMMFLANSPVNYKPKHGYPHAIKAYALAEAFAMTGVFQLEEAMNKSIRVIIDGMQQNGSFDYEYKMKTNRQDLSFAGWNYQALKAAYAAGCGELGLQQAIENGIKWLKKYAGSKSDGKGFPYAIIQGKVKDHGRHSMRPVGVLCLQLFGEGKIAAVRDEIAAIIENDLPKLNWGTAPKSSLYAWYYATQAMFQHGGDKWKAWNKKFQKEVINNQHTEGYWVYPGKSHVGAIKDQIGQKVYSTTLCALMLTVYYRYLPSGKGAIGTPKKEAKKKTIDDIGLDLID
ncbi:MAG: hypothetical protein MK132_00500 [Lentisphaerales bacterium]|nr:hypothetical protein [Lentisphaerales bacterium]